MSWITAIWSATVGASLVMGLEPQCEIVGTACDGRTLIELALKTNLEIIVLDISMPKLNGLR